jgi:hypothetical protein
LITLRKSVGHSAGTKIAVRLAIPHVDPMSTSELEEVDKQIKAHKEQMDREAPRYTQTYMFWTVFYPALAYSITKVSLGKLFREEEDGGEMERGGAKSGRTGEDV